MAQSLLTDALLSAKDRHPLDAQYEQLRCNLQVMQCLNAVKWHLLCCQSIRLAPLATSREVFSIVQPFRLPKCTLKVVRQL